MEINEQNVETMVIYLQQTFSADPSIRKPAEKFLQHVESNDNFGLLLLHVTQKQDGDMTVRVAAAINFKNYVRRNWRVIEDSPDRISTSNRDAIRKNIVDLMLSMPEQIQRQLSDAVSIIGREDFPDRWPQLLPDMVRKFQSGDFHIINGVLRTGHSLFKRYRHEFKSQKLWKEIKYVLETVAEPLTELVKATMELVKVHIDNAANLKIIFSSLTLICKLFYSLNSQDLPEFFEDNMSIWMEHFHTLLTADYKIIKTSDDEEAGVLEHLKSQICDNVSLYAQKYDEEFQPYLPNFVTAIWTLLVTTGNQVKYDLLVSNAIGFLSSVCEKTQYKDLFENRETLTNICEKVIVPNMEFRTEDEELFEDNPEEYIRRDIEGSDMDTRRRAACDLVKGLCRHFEGPVTQIFSQYVSLMLQVYGENPEMNWKNKDAAIYLVTSLASKAATAKHGITQANQLVNLTEFCTGHIIPDLQQNNVDKYPVLKADALKYVMTFRSQLPKEALLSCVPSIIAHLRAESIVVHTYAAHTLERLFTMKAPGGATLFTTAEIVPYVESLLGNIFMAMSISGSEENEYLMKALMRTFSMVQEAIIPYLPTIVSQLTDKLITVSKNPSKPHFNHYMFESISLSVKISCRKDPSIVTNFETALFPAFQHILETDVQEFVPYVFQVMSLLLELHMDKAPDTYMALFPHLLSPILWERNANIPPLVRLVQAYISKNQQSVSAPDNLNGVLGVFQKLIASKTNDHEGFYLVGSIIEHLSQSVISSYLKQIFILLFQRLQSSKTTKFVKSLLVFYCLFIIKYGSPALVEIVDSIQSNMFGMVIEKLIIADVQKVSGQIERKICAVGLTKLLTECPAMLSESYIKFWAPLLETLIGLFELPEDDSVPDDEHFIDVEDLAGYQTAYSQLVFAGKPERDPLNGRVQNPRSHLAHSLHKLSQQHPGKLMPMINSNLPQDASKYLNSYLTTANISLS